MTVCMHAISVGCDTAQCYMYDASSYMFVGVYTHMHCMNIHRAGLVSEECRAVCKPGHPIREQDETPEVSAKRRYKVY